MSGKNKSLSKKSIETLDAIAAEGRELDEQIARDQEDRKLGDFTAFGFIKDDPESDLGRRLREAREYQKLTQGELADRTKLADRGNVGITRNVISFIESGRTQVGPREIRLLSEALRLSPNFLIYGSDDPFDNMTELHRYGGQLRTDAEFHAYITYCVSRLHHNHRTIFIELMLGILRGWNKDFDSELHKNAIPEFIKAAKELEALEEKRNKTSG